MPCCNVSSPEEVLRIRRLLAQLPELKADEMTPSVSEEQVDEISLEQWRDFGRALLTLRSLREAIAEHAHVSDSCEGEHEGIDTLRAWMIKFARDERRLLPHHEVQISKINVSYSSAVRIIQMIRRMSTLQGSSR